LRATGTALRVDGGAVQPFEQLARARSTSSVRRVAATLSTMFFGTYHVPDVVRKIVVISSTVSTVPAIGQPSGWSPGGR
jgi:hypothetical protein